MMIYLLTFYLFDDIKKYRNHSCKSFCCVKDNFDKKCTCNMNVYIFYLRFALGIINVIVLTEENKTKNNYFIQVNPPFLDIEFSNTVTF